MPVPKGKQDLYGKVVGANINRGKSLDAAKAIADKAVKSKPKCKACGKSHGEHGAYH